MRNRQAVIRTYRNDRIVTQKNVNYKMETPGRKTKPVNDEFREARQELKLKAQTLQKYVHFEASMKPHLEKLHKEVRELAKKCDEHEADINKMEKAIKREKQRKRAVGERMDDADREEKVERIRELQEEYEKLIAKKAKYLQDADLLNNAQ